MRLGWISVDADGLTMREAMRQAGLRATLAAIAAI